MNTREKIINSLQDVVSNPKHVFIDTEVIKNIAKDFLNTPVPSWDNELQFIGTAQQTAQYYFFVDSINFCFWSKKGQEKWQYKIGDEWVSGYYAYSRAIKDAFIKDNRFFDADFLSSISYEDFISIFNGKNELLLLNERFEIIKENFTILKDKFNGQAINLLKQANNDTDKLVDLLIENFPSFRDIVEKDGKKYFFLKRAQIFPSDISFVGIDGLKLSNLENLTVFADYKLPQILESFGVLKYGDELNQNIINEDLIPAGSIKEIELRASSIIAIEKIHDELVQLGRDITSGELDWILWVAAKSTKFAKPHHKTLTTFY
jgi:hypothetical protein